MLRIDLPASMECIECDARLSVKLVLTLGGVFAARAPDGHGWQIQASETGVLICRCPAHRLVIEQVQPQLVGARH